VINDNTAQDNVCVLESLHPSVIDVARKAATAVGLRLAGVDLITPNSSRCLSDVGGVVLEVNSAPGFYFHYAGDSGCTPVAVPVLAACLNHSIDCDAWKTRKSTSSPEIPYELTSTH